MTGLDFLTSMRCMVCGKAYPPSAYDYVCPCSGDNGVLDAQYDYARLKAAWDRDALAANPDHSMWRYAPLLPIMATADHRPPTADHRPPTADHRPSTADSLHHTSHLINHESHITNPQSSVFSLQSPLANVGGTPLYAAPRIAQALGLREVWIKDDGRNPSASLKDRASAVAVLKALERQARIITTASSGNAAAALACMAAAVGMKAIIFVPQTAPTAKVAQLLVFGAEVFLVKGTYDQAFDLCLQASRQYGWYCRSTAYNPYTVEGKKTVSLEICEQLGWQAPDRIFVSVGDGNIIAGVCKGLLELHQLGWIERVPQVIGVQAARSDVLCTAWERGTETIEPIDADTVADSISVGVPRDAVRALRLVRATGGEFIRVTDEQILAAIPRLAQTAAVFAEPAGATAYAGLVAMAETGRLDPNERVVVIVTGNGLKDIPSAMKTVGEPMRVEPNLSSLSYQLSI